MEDEKYVDEGWKESVAREKDLLRKKTEQKQSSQDLSANRPEPPVPQTQKKVKQTQQSTSINFLNYISSLVYQAMVFLGEIPNPITNEMEENLEQAKLMVETLILIREKTSGNLTQEESDLLNASLYELQMKFVEKSQKDSVQSPRQRP